MKKLLSIGFILTLSLVLTACGQTKEEEAAEQILDKIGNAFEEAIDENLDEETADLLKENLESVGDVQNELEELAEEMPKVVEVATYYRDCLKDADKKDDAVECYEDADKMADDLGLEKDENQAEFDADSEFGEWSDEEKELMILQMDQGISMMQMMMPQN